MSKAYLNKVELKDGQIVLFHRTANSKRPVYHMRIHIRGMRDIYGNKLTYWQSTTNESDLDEARSIALKKFYELQGLVREGRNVEDLTFHQLYALWWKAKKVELSLQFAAKGRVGQTQRINWYEKQSRRYWLDYFGAVKLSALNQEIVSGYWNWRIEYWAVASDDEKKKHPNFALKPSKKTLDMEQSSLREVFAWAVAHKHMTYAFIVKSPYSRKGIKATRRASFERADFEKLCDYMDRWVIGKGDADVRVNARHLYQRKLLQIYIYWLAYTGMRTGEVLELRHGDVGYGLTERDQTPILRISVPRNTKTGERLARSNPALLYWYEALTEHTGTNASENWLFVNSDGTRNDGFVKTMTKLFDEAGVLRDMNGDKRTAYSLRHYFAEQKLEEMGVTPYAYQMLCDNMGTSKTQIENHYLRRGTLTDEDLYANGDGRRKLNNTGKREMERALRGLKD